MVDQPKTASQFFQLKKDVQLSPEQLVACFSEFVNGQLSVIVQHAPPWEIANVLMGKAATLMASVQQGGPRDAMISELLRGFRSTVHEREMQMRTTPGGIIRPNRPVS